MAADSRPRVPRALLAGVFVLTAGLYVATLCPTVHWDDSGELITAAYVLGIPHPPGEPLYTMLGWAFTHLPGLPSPAYGLNLMSALFGALTWTCVAGWLWDVLRRCGTDARVAGVAAAAGAVTAAAGRITWYQSVIAENTTLHTLFVAALVWWAWRLGTGPRRDDRPLFRHMLAWAFVYGLSAANHPAGVFLFPALAIWFLATQGRRLLRPQWVLAMLACTAVGFLPYSYLYFASRANPPLDWGNPETLKNLWWVVTAAQYKTNALRGPSWASLYLGSWNLVRAVAAEWGWGGTVVLCLGWVRLVTRDKALALWPLAVLVVFTYLGSNPAYIGAYLVPAFLFLTPALAAGVAWVCEAARQRGPAAGRGGVVLACLLPVSAVSVHAAANNLRRDDLAKTYGEYVLAQLPPNAILVTESGHMRFVLLYLQHCEGRRPDVALVSANAISRPGYLKSVAAVYPDLVWPESYELPEESPAPEALSARAFTINPPWTRAVLLGLYAANADRRRMFWENPAPYAAQLGQFARVGVVYELRAMLADGRIAAWQDTPASTAAGDDVPPPWDPRVESRVGAKEAYAQALGIQADVWAAQGRLAPAADAYTRAWTLNPDNPAYPANLGIVLAGLGRTVEAESAFLAAVRHSPEEPMYAANLAYLYHSEGHLEAALPWARQAARHWPDAPWPFLMRLAELEATVGDGARSVQALQAVVRLRPNDGGIQRTLAIMALDNGRLDVAAQAVEAAVRLEPGHVHTWFAAARLAVARGDGPESVEAAVAQMLACDPVAGRQLLAADPALQPYDPARQQQP